MGNKFLCEGKEPFVFTSGGIIRKEVAREANKQYYGLKGLTIKTHSLCPYCHRKSCKDRQACKSKLNKKIASRSVMAERYAMNNKD